MHTISRHLKQAGFTMIELLVVIAVIGVLAVAVLSSINPIEQINKGRDTRLRSNAAQLLSAIDRYYSIQEEYPWNTIKGGGSVSSEVYPATGETTCRLDDTFCLIGGPGEDTGPSWLSSLVETNEVKQAFVTQLLDKATSNVLKLTKPENGDVSVCFQPSSAQFKLEAVKNCMSGGNSMPEGACASDYSDVTAPSANDWTVELICLP